jgi:hypothetical protein
MNRLWTLKGRELVTLLGFSCTLISSSKSDPLIIEPHITPFKKKNHGCQGILLRTDNGAQAIKPKYCVVALVINHLQKKVALVTNRNP